MNIYIYIYIYIYKYLCGPQQGHCQEINIPIVDNNHFPTWTKPLLTLATVFNLFDILKTQSGNQSQYTCHFSIEIKQIPFSIFRITFLPLSMLKRGKIKRKKHYVLIFKWTLLIILVSKMFTFDVFYKILGETESMKNSRPPQNVSDALENDEKFTPNQNNFFLQLPLTWCLPISQASKHKVLEEGSTILQP